MSTPFGLNTKSVVHGVELRADTAIQGLQTAMPSGVTQITVGKVTYKLPDLVTYAQSLEQPWKTVRSAHATIRQAMLTRPADYQKLIGFLADLRIALSAVLGRDSEVLTSFGFKPEKARTPLTPEEKTLRAAKAKLTRQKRGTLGSKQKAAIRQTENPSVSISPEGAVSIDGATGQATQAGPTPPASSSQTPNAGGSKPV